MNDKRLIEFTSCLEDFKLPYHIIILHKCGHTSSAYYGSKYIMNIDVIYQQTLNCPACREVELLEKYESGEYTRAKKTIFG